ncbi:pseudouridine synthase [Staphylococcus saprophyticus]|jgi:tRNA pseudouridine38-40 synthase|uniref:tRNA pseudouridine synthase A n=2 Tax=Staphylococcus saprophyticus TaxID=29385 RepID=TRUA_STAS1|nr:MULTISPECIES: tRNA pseudouridine(38-40) synthase TruA [Staphylococcus]Q49ZD7.1 RecName: Full=tRNA pseudouridine synthase A; AltName: Full=tRNA pseudouridine(38-40) synthase; AltName: Full=tRNA pseudouridylate synthase I; AltName: Full=tRNA-uridine isomerase I [Staphylococcus saprophyticus subsp. saprophyticus ATCC 15305 = NCTC 7292]CRV28688.1 tRNA pseudouridine synthase A [Streptococcus equi subsp. equi]AMG19765.1 tRNA pseudouridine(38-40) synthase TruA [Staphylococcus saprophyticus]AMG32869
MRVLVNISYQGSQFLGFQIQQHGRTIQQQFEKILKRMHKHEVRIHPSSRTDRGVHAIEQYFHFDTELNIPEQQWQYAMNRALPDDIYVNDVSFVNDDFHCRYDCVGKSYRYKIYQSAHKDPFLCGLKTYVPEQLDIEKMNMAAQHFIGTHDFTGFCSQKTEVESKIRTLYESRIEKTESGFDYIVTGSGFLYNMVRVLIAFLIEVGKGKREPQEVPQLLEARDRNQVPFTAPAEGLYLEKIYLTPNELIQDFGNNIKIHQKKSSQNL